MNSRKHFFQLKRERRCERRRERRRGAAIVEFAIVAPFFALLLMGIVEFGRALHVQQNLTTAAREAAREAILPGATAESVEAVTLQFLAQPSFSSVEIEISPDLSSAASGDAVTVSVKLPLKAVSKLGSVWLGSGLQISASAVMRKEGYE